MKIAAVADCHLGNMKRFGGDMQGSLNARCRAGLDVFARAADAALEARADIFLVAGDLFDYSRPEAQLLAATQRVLETLRQGGCSPVLMKGNHDSNSSSLGDHALAPLYPFATVIENPGAVRMHVSGLATALELFCVPFRPGVTAEWLPKVLQEATPRLDAKEYDNASRVLAVHMGVRDARTAPWLSQASDAIDADVLFDLMAENNITHTIAGNWHDRRRWKRGDMRIFQLGALVPTGFDNPGMTGYGTLGFFDSADGAFTYLEIPGPRFVKAKSEIETNEALRARSDDHEVYLSVTAPPDRVQDITTVLAAGRGRLAGYEVLADEGVAKAEARTAAADASSAETFEAALEAYVREMPLPDGVDRASVLEKTRSYL